MDYIITITNSETDESEDIYWIEARSTGTPFGTLRECGYTPDGPVGSGKWSKPGHVTMTADVSEWYRCWNEWCVSDRHDGDQHVDATGRSFSAEGPGKGEAE